MDEDIELARSALHDLLKGFGSVARNVISTNAEITEDERVSQRAAADGVERMLKGLIDLGALAIAKGREAEDD